MSGRIMRVDVHEELQAKYDDAMAELAILRDGWNLTASLFVDCDEAPDVDALSDDFDAVQTRLNDLYHARMKRND